MDLGTAELFAECMCNMVYTFEKVWVKPEGSSREESHLGLGWGGFWEQKRYVWYGIAEGVGRGGMLNT